uniref:Threonine deaminase (ILV1) n=1 Tax=Saccharomyces cerevisiae TaxID=4932 RepID=Q7LIH0_YEASX|nr:ORF1 [Saccharomyces cerevisiae]CAA25697.1 unnamed protein product [Saccharomyces cerevisiae]
MSADTSLSALKTFVVAALSSFLCECYKPHLN